VGGLDQRGWDATSNEPVESGGSGTPCPRNFAPKKLVCVSASCNVSFRCSNVCLGTFCEYTAATAILSKFPLQVGNAGIAGGHDDASGGIRDLRIGFTGSDHFASVVEQLVDPLLSSFLDGCGELGNFGGGGIGCHWFVWFGVAVVISGDRDKIAEDRSGVKFISHISRIIFKPFNLLDSIAGNPANIRFIEKTLEFLARHL